MALSIARCDSLDRAALLGDLKDSKSLLEDLSGKPVNGYRAASFSVTRKNLWALEAIAEAGYKYSSSIYPIRHDLYWHPEAPRFAFRPFAASSFLEIPVTSFRLGNINLPAGGGGYSGCCPIGGRRSSCGRSAARTRPLACSISIPGRSIPASRASAAPRSRPASAITTNLGTMQRRLQKILGEFSWARVDAVYPV